MLLDKVIFVFVRLATVDVVVLILVALILPLVRPVQMGNILSLHVISIYPATCLMIPFGIP